MSKLTTIAGGVAVASALVTLEAVASLGGSVAGTATNSPTEPAVESAGITLTGLDLISTHPIAHNVVRPEGISLNGIDQISTHPVGNRTVRPEGISLNGLDLISPHALSAATAIEYGLIAALITLP
jgi:hypothetical protein